jgi:alpha-beta hydrolase superfamily lysophospholipase
MRKGVDMEHFESSWTTEDGLELYHQGWIPEDAPRGVVLLVHGLGEHSERYRHVGEFMTANGLAMLTFDLRGHGRSAGARGHTPSFEKFMDDIDLLFAEAQQRYPGKGRFLYGHSLGGILVLNYVLRRKPALNGVISTSAGLRTALEEQKLKVGLARVFGSLLPGVQLPTGLDPAAISHDPEVVDRYRNDPLVHAQASFAMAKYTLQAIDWAYEHASEFPAPLLLMHGSGDQLAYPRGSKEFADLVPGDCTLKIWDDLYHELHNEPQKDAVLSYVLSWINARL